MGDVRHRFQRAELGVSQSRRLVRRGCDDIDYGAPVPFLIKVSTNTWMKAVTRARVKEAIAKGFILKALRIEDMQGLRRSHVVRVAVGETA